MVFKNLNSKLNMKKIIYLSLFLAASLISCNDEDGPNTASTDSIIGKWGNYQDVFLADNETIEYSPYNEVITFRSNGTSLSEGTAFGDAEGTWENLGNGKYKFSWGPLSVIHDVEFLSGNRFINYDTEDSGWAYYFVKIN